MSFKLDQKHTQILEDLESSYRLTYVNAGSAPAGITAPFIRCEVVDKLTNKPYARGYSQQVGAEGEKEATINAIKAAQSGERPKRPHEVMSEQAALIEQQKARIAELEAQAAKAAEGEPQEQTVDEELDALRTEYEELASKAPDKRWGIAKLRAAIDEIKSA